MMVPKWTVDHSDTLILKFCVDIMQNEPTKNSDNFSWNDFDSLGLRLNSNIGSNEPLQTEDSSNRTSSTMFETNSIASRIEEPYIELPDQTYRQIKELNDALIIQAQRITAREEKLSQLIVDFEREKREFDRKKLGSNDQVERRLDLLIAQSVKRSIPEMESPTSSSNENVVTSTENQAKEDSTGFDHRREDQLNTIVPENKVKGLTPSPRPAFSRMKIAAREALQAAEFTRLIQRKERADESTSSEISKPVSVSRPNDGLSNGESESLETLIHEAIDSETTEMIAKREAAMKVAASAAAKQLGRFDAAQRKSMSDTLSDLSPPEYDTVDPDINGPDTEITRRFNSSAKQLREKSEVLSAVFVELDQMVRDLDRQQELLEKIQVDRDSLSASEFELVNKKLKRRFNRISKKISVNSDS